jgi:hypothetical protein
MYVNMYVCMYVPSLYMYLMHACMNVRMTCIPRVLLSHPAVEAHTLLPLDASCRRRARRARALHHRGLDPQIDADDADNGDDEGHEEEEVHELEEPFELAREEEGENEGREVELRGSALARPHLKVALRVHRKKQGQGQGSGILLFQPLIVWLVSSRKCHLGGKLSRVQLLPFSTWVFV